MQSLPHGKAFQITSINLNNNQFLNDACAKRFKGIEGLKKLSLQNTGFADAAVRDLKSLTDLEEMDLSGTKVTAQGIAELQEALPNCKTGSPKFMVAFGVIVAGTGFAAKGI